MFRNTKLAVRSLEAHSCVCENVKQDSKVGKSTIGIVFEVKTEYL